MRGNFSKTAQVLIRIPPQPNVQLTLKPADDAVQAAIGELDRGAHTGPQDCAEQLGAGASQMKEGDRLRSIVDLLHSARNEINQETSNADWRASALKHINAALDAVHRAAVNAHLDREIGSFVERAGIRSFSLAVYRKCQQHVARSSTRRRIA